MIILDKLANLFINMTVAGFALAIFQGKEEIFLPACSCLILALALSFLLEILK